MAYPKGKPRPEGSGRKKGTPNKVTAQIRSALAESFKRVGGVEYLARMAEQEPRAYLALIAKLIPSELHATLENAVVLKLHRNYKTAEMSEERTEVDDGAARVH